MTPRFAAIGLVATDMARSIAFYRQLGLTFPDGAEEQPHAEAPLPGGLRLMLDSPETVQSFDPSFDPAKTGGPGLAFECGSPSEVDEVYAAMVGAGWEGHLAPWDAFWGQRYAMVRDPDGNGVDLFAPSA
jgi:catechol 2,3-dioxygenase-like lactoylglutathione lyase family enzyme